MKNEILEKVIRNCEPYLTEDAYCFPCGMLDVYSVQLTGGGELLPKYPEDYTLNFIIAVTRIGETKIPVFGIYIMGNEDLHVLVLQEFRARGVFSKFINYIKQYRDCQEISPISKTLLGHRITISECKNLDDLECRVHLAQLLECHITNLDELVGDAVMFARKEEI